eukprot:3639805-Pyramimonas_sp.AAC.1
MHGGRSYLHHGLALEVYVGSSTGDDYSGASVGIASSPAKVERSSYLANRLPDRPTSRAPVLGT